ncbi:hypothetical protein PSPO01_16430 [Paraphaeosphaeria sporulosa]
MVTGGKICDMPWARNIIFKRDRKAALACFQSPSLKRGPSNSNESAETLWIWFTPPATERLGCHHKRRNHAVSTGKALVGYPNVESQGRDAKRHKGTAGGSRNAKRNQSKRQPTSDDENDHLGRPHNPNKPTFIAIEGHEGGCHAAFTRDVECNFAALDHTLAMMATRTLPLQDAWIVDSGCAPHVCNNASRFVYIDKYDGPPIQSVDDSTSASGVKTVNVLGCTQSKTRWLILDNVLLVPSTREPLWSNYSTGAPQSTFQAVCQYPQENKSENRLRGQSIPWSIYARPVDQSFLPAYHISPQMRLWHNRFAHLSDGNLRRLSNKLSDRTNVEPREPCNPHLEGRITEKPYHHPGRKGEYPMESLRMDVAGPQEGLDGSRYWLTIVDGCTGWMEIIPISRRRESVIESLQFFFDTTRALGENADAYASTVIRNKWEQR